jgi:metal-responsive CopG/Arc/MetJ family transcriptional regulator
MGRTKLYGTRIVLPLPDETLAQIDELLTDGETRLDLIRDAIDRELKRRAPAKKPGKR